jgi:hypothetical protein
MSARKNQKGKNAPAPARPESAEPKNVSASPTFPIAGPSRDVLQDVKVDKGKLIIPFENHQELAAKLAHLTAHVLDAQAVHAIPALVPADTSQTIPYGTGTNIVASCADSNDWSMTVGDCVPDLDTFRSCLAQKILADGFKVPDLTKFNATSTLDTVLSYVLEAHK